MKLRRTGESQEPATLWFEADRKSYTQSCEAESVELTRQVFDRKNDSSDAYATRLKADRKRHTQICKRKSKG